MLEREAKVRADLINPRATSIDTHFFPQQVGLRPVMVDPIGRLWDVGNRPWIMIFDPKTAK